MGASGFRGFGFRFEGSGFRTWGLQGLGDLSLGLRVQGSGLGASGFRGVGFRLFRVSGLRLPESEYTQGDPVRVVGAACGFLGLRRPKP